MDLLKILVLAAFLWISLVAVEAEEKDVVKVVEEELKETTTQSLELEELKADKRTDVFSHKTTLIPEKSQEGGGFFSKLTSWLLPFGDAAERKQYYQPQSQHLSPVHQQQASRDKCNPCNAEPWIPVVGKSGKKTILGFAQPSEFHQNPGLSFTKLESVKNSFSGVYQSYGTPSINYGTPSQNYGTPSFNKPSSNYGSPSQNYGTPSLNAPSQNYGTPSLNAPSQNYGAPSLNLPSQNYDIPSQNYGAPTLTAPSQNYGTPSQNYGTPSLNAPSQNYGTPSQNYGTPSLNAPSQNYGTPSQNYGTPSLNAHSQNGNSNHGFSSLAQYLGPPPQISGNKGFPSSQNHGFKNLPLPLPVKEYGAPFNNINLNLGPPPIKQPHINFRDPKLPFPPSFNFNKPKQPIFKQKHPVKGHNNYPRGASTLLLPPPPAQRPILPYQNNFNHQQQQFKEQIVPPSTSYGTPLLPSSNFDHNDYQSFKPPPVVHPQYGAAPSSYQEFNVNVNVNQDVQDFNPNYGAPIGPTSTGNEQLSLATNEVKKQQPIPFPNLSATPIVPIYQHQNFYGNNQHQNQHQQQQQQQQQHSNNDGAQVQIIKSITTADFLSSVEHPINVIQSPIVEINTNERDPSEEHHFIQENQENKNQQNSVNVNSITNVNTFNGYEGSSASPNNLQIQEHQQQSLNVHSQNYQQPSASPVQVQEHQQQVFNNPSSNVHSQNYQQPSIQVQEHQQHVFNNPSSNVDTYNYQQPPASPIQVQEHQQQVFNNPSSHNYQQNEPTVIPPVKLSENPIIVESPAEEDTHTAASNLNVTTINEENVNDNNKNNNNKKRGGDEDLGNHGVNFDLNLVKEELSKLPDFTVESELLKTEFNVPNPVVINHEVSKDFKEVKTEELAATTTWKPVNNINNNNLPSSVLSPPPLIHSSPSFSPSSSPLVSSNVNWLNNNKKNTKQLQIIIPYTTSNNPNIQPQHLMLQGRKVPSPPLHPTPFNNQPKLSLYTQPPTLESVWHKFESDFAMEVSNSIPTAFPTTQMSTMAVQNIKDLLKGEQQYFNINQNHENNNGKEKLPFDIIRLQKNIDGWTEQEYSSFKLQQFNNKKPSTSSWNPSKQIPDEYLTTLPYNINNVEEEKTTPKFYDHEPAGSNNNLVDVENNLILDTSTEELNGITSTTSTEKAVYGLVQLINDTTPDWQQTQVSISPATKEKVYVVTPQTPKFIRKEEQRKAKKNEVKSIVKALKAEIVKQENPDVINNNFGEWPHLINELETTTPTTTTKHPLVGLMDLSSYTPPPNSTVETYAGHSKVITIVTPSPSQEERTVINNSEEEIYEDSIAAESANSEEKEDIKA